MLYRSRVDPLWFPAVLVAAAVAAAGAARAPLPVLPPRVGRRIVVAATLLYAAFFFNRAVRGVDDLLFGYDLAHVRNILWNTREGRPFHSSFLEAPILAHHLYLWLLPLAWLSLLVDPPLLVQGLQVAAMAAAAAPLYALGRREGGEGLGVAVALAYLFHAGTNGQTQSGFDPASLAVPCLALALWADAAGRPGLALAAIAAALPAKEHLAGAAAVWGLLRLRRWPRHAAAALALSAAWIALSVGCTAAFSVGASQAAIRLRGFGDGPAAAAIAAAAEAVRPAKIGYLLHLLAPLGFFSLLGAPSLLSLPEAALVLVSAFPMHHLLSHYTAATVAPLAAGAAVGAGRVIARAPAESKPAVRRAVVAFLLVSAAGHAWLSGLLPGGRIWLAEFSGRIGGDADVAHAEADRVRALAAAVPPEAGVGFRDVETPMLLLAERSRLYYDLPYARRAPPSDLDVWFTRPEVRPPVEGYEVAGRSGQVVMWRRIARAPDGGAPPEESPARPAPSP